MSKMYLYNDSKDMNMIITLSTHSFSLPPQTSYAVDARDPNVDKFLKWYPNLSLVATPPNKNAIENVIANKSTVSTIDLAETAKALEDKMKKESQEKIDDLSVVAKQLEQDVNHKVEVANQVVHDTAKALEEQQNKKQESFNVSKKEENKKRN